MRTLLPILTTVFLSVGAQALTLQMTSDQADLVGCSAPKYILAGSEGGEVRFDIGDAKVSQRYQVVVYENGAKKTFETKKNSFTVSLDKLPDDLQRMNYTVMVQGKTDAKEFASKNFEVVRPVLIEASSETGKGCYTQYETEPFSGLITNSTSQNRTETISNKEVKSQVTQKERSTSWLLRLTFFGLVDVGPSLGFLKSEANEKTQMVERNLTTTILPGETVIIGKRKTLMKVHYNVFAADACGNHERVGDAYLSYVQTEYPAVSVSPDDADPFMKLRTGENAPKNTCLDEVEGGNEIIFDINNL